MIVTATEFKSNVGKFIQLSQEEDILILKNGKLVTKLTRVEPDDKLLKKLEAFNKAAGFLKSAKNSDIDKLREERILGEWTFFLIPI